MIKVVSFYKDINFGQEKSKKLKQRMMFDYKDCQKKLFETLKKFDKENNCEFIVSTDNRTDLKNYPLIKRIDLDDKLLMESVCIANNDFVQQEQGRIILLGADHLFCGNPELFFDTDFDLLFLIVDNFDDNHYTNINNTIIVVNSNPSNIRKIRDFFNERLKICLNLPLHERHWYADQKSLSILLERQNIITNYHKTKNTIHNFNGLKIKLVPWGSRFLKVVDCYGNYKKDTDDVLIDFCGKADVKKHLGKIYNDIMSGK